MLYRGFDVPIGLVLICGNSQVIAGKAIVDGA
jgi:hypothetical protein